MTGPTPAADGKRGPVDASLVPRFAGPATFARLPRLDEVSDLDVAVFGIPFDAGVSYRPGARFGPAHVRESSRLLRPYNPAVGVSPFARLQVVDAGDVAVNPFSIEEASSGSGGTLRRETSTTSPIRSRNRSVSTVTATTCHGCRLPGRTTVAPGAGR